MPSVLYHVKNTLFYNQNATLRTVFSILLYSYHLKFAFIVLAYFSFNDFNVFSISLYVTAIFLCVFNLNYRLIFYLDSLHMTFAPNTKTAS